jgi:hypothetical protein
VQDRWYADNRDLVKWGILLRLAEMFGVQCILQLAFYRPSAWSRLVIDGHPQDLPGEVIAHFRDLRRVCGISTKVRVTVFDRIFANRVSYLQAVLEELRALPPERRIVFLDPDTGLEPRRPDLKHVLNTETRAIWEALKKDDMLVFYQHQTNRTGLPWIEPKQIQLAKALGVPNEVIRRADAPEIANDVVFFFSQKK